MKFNKSLVVATTLVAGMSLGLLHAEEEGAKGKGKGDPAKRAEMILKSADTDENGTLSAEEFAASKMGAKMTADKGADMVDKAFARMDADGNGELDKAELSKPPKGKGKGDGEKGKGKGKGKGDKSGDKEEAAAE